MFYPVAERETVDTGQMSYNNHILYEINAARDKF
jgi:hypothetical protein